MVRAHARIAASFFFVVCLFVCFLALLTACLLVLDSRWFSSENNGPGGDWSFGWNGVTIRGGGIGRTDKSLREIGTPFIGAKHIVVDARAGFPEHPDDRFNTVMRGDHVRRALNFSASDIQGR